MDKQVFFSSSFEQKKTIETLLEESKTDSDFYLFLSFSAFITALGLLINNSIVIIGAMLIAPLLFPILSLGMGVVTSSILAIKRALINLLKSVSLVVVIAFVTTFFYSDAVITEQLMRASDEKGVFFLIAFFSGVVASFSWVKQNSSSLPGVAVTVSLVPPLATVGVSLALLNKELFTGSTLLFLINLCGIVLASIIIFLLFGFPRLQRVQDKKIVEEKNEEREKELEKIFNQDE